MNGFAAWHLPRGMSTPVGQLQAGRATLDVPRLDAGSLSAVCERLVEAGSMLAERPVATIIDAIDAASLNLQQPGELHDQALELLPLVTGYSPAMARLVLARMAADWRAPALRMLIQAELGSENALDVNEDTARHRRVYAFGPRLAFQVFAGNVPGVAVTSMIRTLLLRSPSLCKTSLGEPVLPVLFARALDAVDPALADALAVLYWPGGTTSLEAAVLEYADTIIVYGGDAAVRALRMRSTPQHRFIEHGPRFSVGVIKPGALKDDDLDAIATAVATFDQQGCVSPHILWVVGDVEQARGIAARLAPAFARIEAGLPRGEIGTAEKAAIHELRSAYEFRAIAGREVDVHADAGTAWTIVHDPEPDIVSSCLNRFVFVKPVSNIDALVDVLKPHAQLLQSVGVIGFSKEETAVLAHRLGRLGASRIAPFSTLPWPPPWWHHDGRAPLRELLRWTDFEYDG